MIDVVSANDGEDLQMVSTQVMKAKNIMSVQLGSLEYNPDFGIDIAYFLTDLFKFQNESFKAYIVNVLTDNVITTTEVLEQANSLSSDFVFSIRSGEDTTAMIAR